MSGVEVVPKKVLVYLEFRADIALPENLAGGEPQAVQLSLGAKGVDAIPINHRTGARSVVVAEAVSEIGRVAEPPVELARARAQAEDFLVIAEAVQKDETVSGNGRGGVARALAHFPDKRRAGLGESCQQPGFGRCRVMRRAEERCPVVGAGSGGERLGRLMKGNRGIGLGGRRGGRREVAEFRRRRVAKRFRGVQLVRGGQRRQNPVGDTG